MRNPLRHLLSLLTLIGTAMAQNPIIPPLGSGPPLDREAVTETLRDYLRVTDNRDRSAISRSFHPTALLHSVTATGTLKVMTNDEWWERVSRIPADIPPRKSRIALIEVVGAAAVARVDITDARGNSSSDLLALLVARLARTLGVLESSE